MIKLIGMFLLISSFVVTGYRASKKFSLRINFLKQYLQFAAYIETKVRYSYENVYELIKNYRGESEFKKFLTKFNENVENNVCFEEAWNLSIYSLPSTYGLKKEDLEALESFSKNFGKSDMKGQLDYCLLLKELIKSSLSTAKEEKEKKGKLSFVLWSMSGISLILTLI